MRGPLYGAMYILYGTNCCCYVVFDGPFIGTQYAALYEMYATWFKVWENGTQ